MGQIKCENKIYKNNNITHYVLSDGQQKVTFPAEVLKAKMLNGEIVVNNLKFSSDGKLIDSKDDNVISEYYRSCKLLGIEPAQIEKMGDDYIITALPNTSTINIPSFVTGFKIFHRRGGSNITVPLDLSNNSAVIEYDDSRLQTKIDTLNLKLEKLINATGYGFKTIDDKFTEIVDYIKDNEVQFKDCYQKVCKIGGFSYEEFGTTKSASFPVDYNDLNANKVFSNKGKYHNPEQFKAACVSNTYKFINLEPTEEISRELYRHLAAVNDIRDAMEAAYIAEMNSTRANALTNMGSTMLSSLTGASIACAAAINPALAIGAGASAIYGLTKDTINTGAGGHIKMRGEFLTWKKMHDVYGSQNGYVSIDKSTLTSDDANMFDAYAADIRVFVIDMLACGYRRGIRDKDQVQNKYKNKGYFRYVKYSIGRAPVDDERLFYFYCRFYLNRVRKYKQETSDKLFDDKYYYTEAGATAIKAYVQCFVNAFFASKKFLGYEGLDFLYDMDKELSNDEKKRYIEFLYYVKYGLLLQGMDADFADYLIQKYLEYDLTLPKNMATLALKEAR